MLSVREILKCPRCGCHILPDATKCPKCGTLYDSNGIESVVDPINYPAKPKLGNTDVEILIANYQLTCARHGKINIKATVIAPMIKCPFC